MVLDASLLNTQQYKVRIKGKVEHNAFWVFGMTRPGIEPRSFGPLANTVLIRSQSINLSIRYFPHGQDVTQGKCLNGVKLVWI